MSKLYQKLLSIQTELKAPKSQYNSFGKYYYRNCEDIQESVKPLLKLHNATLIVSDCIVEVGGRIYVQATATFIDCETGESVSNTSYAREEETKKGMDSSQITGSTSSYARKYALNGLFCIDDSKDADGESKEEKKPNKQELIKQFEEEIKRTKKPLSWFLKNANVTKVEDMDINFLQLSIESLKAYPTK